MKIRSVTVIGCGGTGSHLIPSLARVMAYHPAMMEANLRLWDKDKLEEKNLIRQMFRHDDGHKEMNKAVASALDVQPFIDSDRVHVHAEYVKGPEDLHEWLFYDLGIQAKEEEPALSLVVLAVDNDATRKVVYDTINEFSDLNVAIIDPGNDYYTGNVNLWLRVQGHEPFCHPQHKYEQLVKPSDVIPGGGCSKEVVSTPQLITANKMAATIVLHMIITLLDDQDLAEEITFDLRQFKVANIGDWIKREEKTDAAQQ